MKLKGPDESARRDYLIESNQKTAVIGKLACYVGFPATALLILNDLFVLHHVEFVFWQAILFIPFGLFPILAHSLLRKRADLTILFHTFTILMIIIAGYGQVYAAFQIPDLIGIDMAGVLARQMTSMVVVLALAGGARPTLKYVLTLPLVLSIGYLIGVDKIESGNIALFVSPAIGSLAIVIMASLQEKWVIQEFLMRRLANARLNDLKIGQEKLAYTERNLRGLINAASESILLFDEEGIILEINTTAAYRFGRTREEMVGTNFFSFLSDELRTSRMNIFKATGRSKRPQVFEDISDGIYLENQVNPISMSANDVVFALFSRDITQHKKAEKEKNEMQNQYRIMFQDNRAMMAMIDPLTGAITGINKAAKKFYGYTEEEYPTLTLFDVNPAPGKDLKVLMANIVQSDGAFYDTRHRLKSGEIRDVEIYISPLQLQQHTVLYSIIHDISKRKQAEKEKEEMQNQYRIIFQKSRAIMYMVDPFTGAILQFNDMALKFYGYSEEESSTLKLFDITTTPEANVKDKLADIMLAEGVLFESRHRLKSGEIRDVEVFSSPIQFQHKTVIYSIIHDISKRLLVEKEKEEMREQLFHAEKLASIGTLVAGMAHEICNPLTVINGFSRILAKKLKAVAPSDDSEKTLLAINKATSRIMSIIDGLSTCAQDDIPHLEPLNINEVISEFFTIVQQMAKSADIEIRQKLTLNAPPVLGNRGKTQQVLIHLLNNACDALQSRLSDRLLSIETHLEVKSIVISFKDNGCGIPDAILGKIWDPFFTTKDVGQGVGLGLSICQSTIKSFGGSLNVSSSVGEGTTFYITLPFMYEVIEDPI